MCVDPSQMLPPPARPTRPAESVPAKHLHSSLNKARHPINVVKWTPEGRRLVTASASGEFTLWNGMGFNFETIMQAHYTPIHAMEWSNYDDWLISGSKDGIIKYWQPNFNPLKEIKASDQTIRDLSFSPSDSKFVSASDDALLKIWDFSSGVEEAALKGHGWDAKSVDWHPTKGLLVSGSKDHTVKLWDPRNGRCLTTLHGHKNTITATKFERTRGLCLATSARESTARIFDLRMMRDVLLLKGHDKEISTLQWHPIHSSLLATGSFDGSINYWILDEQNPPEGVPLTMSVYDSNDSANAPTQSIWPAHKVPHAHDQTVWTLDWHPLGHIMCSGSNDRITRFWTRARPGETDCFQDRYHLGSDADQHSGWNRTKGGRHGRDDDEEEDDEADALVDQKMPDKQQGGMPGLPGLPGLSSVPGLPGLSAPPLLGDGPSIGSAPPPQLPFLGFNGGMPPQPPPGMNGLPAPPAIDPAQLQEMIRSGQFPPPPPRSWPPPPGQQPGAAPFANGHPPPLPGLFPPPPNGFAPPPPGFQPPPGFIPPPFQGQTPTQNGNGQFSTPPPPGFDNPESGAAIRRRAPLPSQQDSMMEEIRRGTIRKAR